MPADSSALSKGDSQSYLKLEGMTKRFDEYLAVDQVSLSIQKKEIFALLGSSGCGKSTLLRMLAGMETPSSGKMILDGQDITALKPYERPINMMFQSYALFPHMTVEQNIAFGLKQDRLPAAEIAVRIEEMLDLVQLKKYAKRKPYQLSGGQQQRVALARSLAKKPKLLLLDEPLGALDKKLRQQTQLELVNTLEKVGATCIMVTHDQEEAMTMATRIGIMSEGRLLQVGTPAEIYDYPNCRFTAEFIGETNLIEGNVVVDQPDHVEIKTDALDKTIYINHGITGPEGMQVWVSIRPEDIMVSRTDPNQKYNCAFGKIEEIAYFGSHFLYHVQLPSKKIIKAMVSANHWYEKEIAEPTWGDTLWLSWHPHMPVILTS